MLFQERPKAPAKACHRRVGLLARGRPSATSDSTPCLFRRRTSILSATNDTRSSRAPAASGHTSSDDTFPWFCIY